MFRTKGRTQHSRVSQRRKGRTSRVVQRGDRHRTRSANSRTDDLGDQASSQRGAGSGNSATNDDRRGGVRDLDSKGEPSGSEGGSEGEAQEQGNPQDYDARGKDECLKQRLARPTDFRLDGTESNYSVLAPTESGLAPKPLTARDRNVLEPLIEDVYKASVWEKQIPKVLIEFGTGEESQIGKLRKLLGIKVIDNHKSL